MEIQISVVGQKLRASSNSIRLIDGSQNFVKFTFNLDDSWESLTSYAQFTQNGVAYKVYLDDDNSVFLPHEINEGTCLMALSGTGDGVIATTDFIRLNVAGNILTDGQESAGVTKSLYEQLIDRLTSLEARLDAVEHTVETLS